VRAYWGLVTSREQVMVLERALDRTDAYVGDVRSRVAAGVLPPNDLLTAQAQRARQLVRVVQAKNAAASAELDLGRLVGAPIGQPIRTTTSVVDPVAGMAAVAGQTPDVLVARALEARPERESIHRERRGSAGGAQAAGRRDRRPRAIAPEPALRAPLRRVEGVVGSRRECHVVAA
jgi:Outer membrane efflux protein